MKNEVDSQTFHSDCLLYFLFKLCLKKLTAIFASGRLKKDTISAAKISFKMNAKETNTMI